MRKLKQKQCPICDIMYTPRNSFQKTCYNPTCAIKYTRGKADEKAKKEARAELKQRREKLRSKSDYLKEAQKEFNAYVREKDKDRPCISCGTTADMQYHAGHYKSVGAYPELRFEEDNCHKQCSVCNNHKSGNIIEYRKGLIQRIGIERVEWIEGSHEPKHCTIEDIKAIKAEYRKKTRELKKQRGSNK